MARARARAVAVTSLGYTEWLWFAAPPGPSRFLSRGEVLIQVIAAGVNFGDNSLAHGTFWEPPAPYLSGFEGAVPVYPCDVLIDTNEDSGQDTSDRVGVVCDVGRLLRPTPLNGEQRPGQIGSQEGGA